MNTRKMRMAALMLAVCLSGTAQATLVDRGGGLIYDTDRNITWLQDANYAQTSGYDADGMMTWSDANAWAANLSYYDSVRNVTYRDWRLPEIVPFCDTCDSEFYHLRSELLTIPSSAEGIFVNFGGAYWSSTIFPHPAYPGWYALYYDFSYGERQADLTGHFHKALAFRAGDVAAVPEAETYAMMLVGLGLIGAVARRRRQSKD